MADTKRRPEKEVELTPTYESDADNKYTFCAGTEDEFTILFRIPVGRDNRKTTAKLMQFMKYLGPFFGEGELNPDQVGDFFGIVDELWSEDNQFDEVYFPFAIGLDPGDRRLERVGLMDAFMAFIKALSFISSSFDRPDVKLAQKK